MQNLKVAIAKIPEDFIIHHVAGETFVFSVCVPEAHLLYKQLHEGHHNDIMEKIIRYGYFLLEEKLSNQVVPEHPDLKIVAK